MALRTFLISAALLFLTGCATAPADVARTAAPPAARGMVSAADPRAAEAGAQMLRKGGSATDAAIATMLALTVVEPQSSGIGGGGFYLHGSPDGTVEAVIQGPASAVETLIEWAHTGPPLARVDRVEIGEAEGVYREFLKRTERTD